MMYSSMKAIIFFSGICLQVVFGRQCLQLESGDVSGFDFKKFTGSYVLAMGIMDETLVDWNCHGFSVMQHPHPKGGVNVAISVLATDNSIVDTALVHFNSSTDVYGVQYDTYDRLFNTWVDMHYKILLGTEDLLVVSSCFNNEDNKDDTQFSIVVLRREESKLSISSIPEMLPKSIKNNPELKVLCNK